MRLYDGCPDSELKAIWDELERAERGLRAIEPEAHCTLHRGGPGEGWSVHIWGNELAFHADQLTAINLAIAKLQGGAA